MPGDAVTAAVGSTGEHTLPQRSLEHEFRGSPVRCRCSPHGGRPVSGAIEPHQPELTAIDDPFLAQPRRA